jgi:glycosyltransferase involved in cell wall biosynthesis
MVKRLERKGIERSDQIVVLTRRMRDWLVEQRLAPAEKIEVIPCCVDFARYEAAGDAGKSDDSARKNEGDVKKDGGDASEKNEVRVENDDGDAERFEVVYAGSVTGLYLLEEMGRFFAALKAREPRAFMRVLTKSPPIEASTVLKRAGLSAEDFWVGPAQASEVPALLRRARIGVSFRKATFSQIAASPTKVPEYLAAGLPVVSNAGIGDTDELIEREGVGVVVSELSRESYAAAAERALELARTPGMARRCEEVARAHFDLARVGGARYRDVYRRINATEDNRSVVKANG